MNIVIVNAIAQRLGTVAVDSTTRIRRVVGGAVGVDVAVIGGVFAVGVVVNAVAVVVVVNAVAVVDAGVFAKSEMVQIGEELNLIVEEGRRD